MRKVFVFAAMAAVVGSFVGFGVTPAKAAIISLSDVSASISAPSSAGGAFPVTGTITNTGSSSQSGNSTLTISASGGTVGALPAGCVLSAGKAVCTVANLASGAAKSWTVTVTPAAGGASVTSTATAKSAQAELNVFPDNANNTASAATNVVYTVGSVAITNNPTTVRNGDDTLLTASATNSGAPQNISIAVNTGGIRDTQLALPAGCVVSSGGAVVTCTAAYVTGQTKSFDIAVITPTSGTSITSTANATGATGGSGSASVVTNLFADATAFVPQGDNLTATLPSHTSNFVVQTGSAPGLFLDLNEVALPAGTKCGTADCKTEAAEALFPNSGTYSGSNPAKPFLWDISYGQLLCNGGGVGAQCTDIVYYLPSGATTPIKMAKCSTFGQANATLTNVDQVCLQNATKVGSNWTFRIALLRDIVIPILSGSSK